MKVLLLLTDLFEAVGGIQTFNRVMVKALDEIAQKRKWTVEVLVLNDDGDHVTPECYFGCERTECRLFRRRKLSFARYALIHALDASIIILGHVNFSPLALALRLFAPRVFLFLMVYGVEVWRRLPLFQRLGIKQSDRIVSISKSTRDKTILFNGFDCRLFDILPCTLGPLYEKEMASEAKEGAPLPLGRMILSVSRLESSESAKGIEKVIESLPRVVKNQPDAVYVIVGEGSDRHRLERLAKELGVSEKVFFAGQLSDRDLASYYKACHVFVLPSLKEGFGIVFLEAMYYAKPCIGSPAGGIPEVITDGKTGFLVDPNDTQSLADCLIRLVSDDALRLVMGQAGKMRFEQEFSFDIFRQRLEAILCANNIMSDKVSIGVS